MDQRLLRADELGIRLEIVGGLPTWEPSPVWKHQPDSFVREMRLAAAVKWYERGEGRR